MACACACTACHCMCMCTVWLPAWPHTSRWCNAVPPALRMWSKVTMADGKVLSKERHGAELQQACLCNQCSLCNSVHDALCGGFCVRIVLDMHTLYCAYTLQICPNWHRHSLTASRSSSCGQTRARRTYCSSTTTPRSTLGRSAGAAAERCCRPTGGDMISGHDATPDFCCGAKVLQE